MPYREKTAWLSLFAMAVTFGPYFVKTAISHVGAAVPNLHQLGMYAICATVQVLILAAGNLWLRHGSPEEARTPLDERDRVIVRRSMGVAYYLLIAGMILVGVVMPFSAAGWKITNAALFMIVAVEMVRYSVIVVSYRRQS